MKTLIATPDGEDVVNWNSQTLPSVVTNATRAHERACATEYTWPALPAHLRAMPSARAMVRHWVRADYHWTPTTFVNNG